MDRSVKLAVACTFKPFTLSCAPWTSYFSEDVQVEDHIHLTLSAKSECQWLPRLCWYVFVRVLDLHSCFMPKTERRWLPYPMKYGLSGVEKTRATWLVDGLLGYGFCLMMWPRYIFETGVHNSRSSAGVEWSLASSSLCKLDFDHRCRRSIRQDDFSKVSPHHSSTFRCYRQCPSLRDGRPVWGCLHLDPTRRHSHPRSVQLL